MAALPAFSAEEAVWKAITFGQSTDVNFSSNVLPEKVGVNDVTIDGRRLKENERVDLSRPVTIESRGGKIANAHDGLTFFYTPLPSSENFVLQATVSVEQFGPENGATPAAQEGAGLLVRDILGQPRQNPLKEGYEEFPAAANMVMNAVMTQDKKDAFHVKMQAISREGITHPWGNAGAAITRKSYKEDLDLRETSSFRLKLERTNNGFVTAWAPTGSDQWVSQTVPRADLIAVQDKGRYYVGFFASRNAKMTISDASLTTSPAKTETSTPFEPKAWPAVMQIMSGSKSLSHDYVIQARANYDGHFRVRQQNGIITADQPVKAGDMFTQPVTVNDRSVFLITYTPTSGSDKTPINQELIVEHIATVQGNTIHAAPTGKANGTGTAEAPLDLATAIALVPAGGKVMLAAGNYPKTDIPLSASGGKDNPKTILAAGKAVIHGMLLDASYWHIEGIEITEKSLRIQGSHNRIENVVAYNNDDTGIQISSPDKLGRPLWASHNQVVNAESFNNEDPGKINADGFAVKMRVGESNRLEGCYAHDNIDDGYDLFNKIEDGANGVVVIENSIARNNTSNGFKLGGEGQPVAHHISNSIAIGNQLDGFTDNFNPGKLVVMNNVAVNNQRFNFLFRPSPYGTPDTQGSFSGNLSLRSKPGKYDDAVVGNVDNSNFFIDEGRSINRKGEVLSDKDYLTLELPQTLERNADGSFKTGEFLTKQ